MRLSPAQVASEINLAKQAVGKGDLEGASDRLAGVLRTNPECAEAHFGKAVILAGEGKNREALMDLEQALRYDPANPDYLAWAAMTSLNLQFGTQGEEFANRLIKVQPQNDRAHFLVSNALSLQNRMDEALESLERALAIRPVEADYIAAKAQLLGRLAWSSQAIEWYRKALMLRPAPELSIELAQALITEGRPVEAISILYEVSSRMPDEDQPHELLAIALTENQEFGLAVDHWGAAERQTFNLAELTLARAKAEINAGRLAVAEGLLLGALADDPHAVQFYEPLTAIKKITSADSPWIEQMERLRSDLAIAPHLERDLCYALGKSYNDLGDFARAMDYYDAANALSFELSPPCMRFDRDAWRAYTDRQIEFFTETKVRELSAQGLESEVPLFILGMIRSGTTLTEQIVSCHSQVYAGGETTFWPDHRSEIFDPICGTFNSAAGKRLGKTFLRSLARHAPDAKYITEKNPSNITIAAMIHCALPNGKVIHVKRHPVDNVLSVWMTPIRTGLPFVYSRQNLVSAFRDYLRLADHLAKVIPNERWISIEYEKLTADPEPTISTMLEFLHVEREEACFHPELNSRTVRTPSYYQVRQPINTDSQEKWRRYEPWLGDFAELLEP